LLERLRNIPTLVIWGREDRMFHRSGCAQRFCN
jgi:hypothetical protein